MLPPLIEFDGQWAPYLEAIYERFLNDLVRQPVFFEGLRVSCPYRPESHGKHYSFWHLVSEGQTEEDRYPQLRRCERIGWIKWMIENATTSADVMCWRNKRGSNTHVVILHKVERYVVVLAERPGYFVLKTAYIATQRRYENLVEEGEATLNPDP